VLPQDVVCLVGDKVLTVAIDSVPASARIYDVGPRTVESFKSYINQGVVIYNGPLGKYEDEHFASASNAMSQYLADMTQSGVITSIVGGGDTLASVTAYEDALIAKFSYASTSGGAMLEWLQNFSLPVVDKLMKHCAGRE
jgi:phosphoglycerate kinase